VCHSQALADAEAAANVYALPLPHVIGTLAFFEDPTIGLSGIAEHGGELY
jgi:hypothetical protein